MTLTAFFLIVFSAVLHASWNMIAKKSSMTVPFYATLCTICAVLWVHTQFWTPIPVFDLPLKFWSLFAASVMSDMIYCWGLIHAYRKLEMSTAYPMMRALPLLFTAILTAVCGWGASLSWLAIAGMIVVFTGCVMMPLGKFSDFNFKSYWTWNFAFVIIAACGTTGYTVFDSQSQAVLKEYLQTAGLDVSSPVMSITYYSTRGLALTSVLWLWILFTPKYRQEAKQLWQARSWMPVLAGLFASLCYITVLISMNYVTNVSYVQVFRQLGLVIGMLEGFLILKERVAVPKIAGVSLILAGLVLSILKF